MFGYAKEDITQKIAAKKRYLSSIHLKEDHLHSKLKGIRSCIQCHYHIRHQKNNIFGFIVLLGLSIGSLVYFEISSIPSMVSLLVAGASVIGVVSSGINLYQENGKLYMEYSDWRGFNLGELSKEENKLFNQEFELEHQQVEITTQIRNLEQELDRLIRFENIHNDFEELKKNPYYTANTTSEYENFVEQRILYDQAFERFLEKGFSPKDVHLDTVLDDDFSYSNKEKPSVKVYKF